METLPGNPGITVYLRGGGVGGAGLQGFSPLSPQFVWNGEDEKAQEGKGGARWSITVVLRFEGILIETWLLLYQWAPLGWDHISSLPYGPIDPQAVKVDNRCVIKYF